MCRIIAHHCCERADAIVSILIGNPQVVDQARRLLNMPFFTSLKGGRGNKPENILMNDATVME